MLLTGIKQWMLVNSLVWLNSYADRLSDPVIMVSSVIKIHASQDEWFGELNMCILILCMVSPYIDLVCSYIHLKYNLTSLQGAEYSYTYLIFYIPWGTLHKVLIWDHISREKHCTVLESCYDWAPLLEREYNRISPSKTDTLENHSLLVMEHLYDTVHPCGITWSWGKSQVDQAVSALVLVQALTEATKADR